MSNRDDAEAALIEIESFVRQLQANKALGRDEMHTQLSEFYMRNDRRGRAVFVEVFMALLCGLTFVKVKTP